MSIRFYLALAAAALFLLWNLDYAPVWNPDEGRYVSASLEMIAPLDGGAPDWVIPHLNTLPRLNKPPLVYWSAASFFKLLGISEPVARLVPALAAIGVLLLLWRMGVRMFGERTGLLAAVVWTTSALAFVLSRMLSTDMLLAFSVTLTLLGLYRLSTPKLSLGHSFGAIAVTGIGLGLALLSKGPVGVALPLLITAAWLLLVDGRRAFTSTRVVGVLGALLIMLLIAGPWYAAIAREHPEFLAGFILGENLARFSGSTTYHDPSPFWYYVPVIFAGLMPWTFLLWPAARNLVEDWKNRRTEPLWDEAARARLFLWIWAIAVVVLFSISKTKLITYVLPAVPAFALLIADGFVTRRARATGEAKPLRQAVGITGIFCLLLGAVLPLLFFSPRILGDKIVPRDVSAPYILLMSVALVAGAVALWWSLHAAAPGILVRRAASTLAAVGVVLFLSITGFMGQYAYYEDVSPMLTALRPHLQPDDRVAQFKTFQPSAMYYTRRPSTIVDFVNTSGLDEEEFATSGDFVQDHGVLQELAKAEQRLFVIVRWKHAHWPTLPELYTIAVNNDYRLLSNRPAPSGFVYNYVAPRKRNRELSPECQALSPEC